MKGREGKKLHHRTRNIRESEVRLAGKREAAEKTYHTTHRFDIETNHDFTVTRRGRGEIRDGLI